MSAVYDCSDPAERAAGLRAAVGAARGGRLVVIPTDTLYGLGCDAFDSEAVASLLAAKHRGRDMPVPVLVGSWQTIDGLVQRVSPQARELVQSFWPGGLSVVVEQAPSLAWDLGDTDGTVMLRMPLHPVAIEVLREVGPMAVSSANVSGGQPSSTVAQAREQLGDSVAVYLDGGPADHAVASTIVDLTGESPVVLREGAVSIDAIAEVLDVEPADLRPTAE
ncbi:L-threonylcarbamoyladenylate synthase [Gordonia sp. (in: high G+C Gram-positive bacteria)]|uniref:L-threonylcarbamoyladenylate synthase n=1 Tax=Gordonia sp. (in: high G+C Gram-positive bacteria) TaxID=84139 RepID=UPI0016A9D4C3|nr:L-threonylcarbamoyladenylate synthase [Gordonia sp. (in: high G+C Gram-positive bacteria)]NLG46772.1 threonylcarbamoyl-AMP synthase [Gordonia sp. (in: high G+C Gram-positive bacteria)]